MRKKIYDELVNRVERLEKALNGGKGSGNFGHSGRPGEVGGSAPSGARGISRTSAKEKAGKTAADMVYDSPMGKYSDGFDNLERATEFLVDHIGEGEGIGEEIAMQYEDSARDRLNMPSRDEESEGAEVSMSEMADLQDEIAMAVREFGLKDLPKDTVYDAVDCALRQGGVEFALGNSKLGQSGLDHDTALRDLKDFIVDFGITDHYGAVKSAESGDFRTAWRSIAQDLTDNIDDEYGRRFGREYFERIDK